MFDEIRRHKGYLNAMISPIISFLFVVKFPNIAIDPHRSHTVDATTKHPINISINIYKLWLTPNESSTNLSLPHLHPHLWVPTELPMPRHPKRKMKLPDCLFQAADVRWEIVDLPIQNGGFPVFSPNFWGLWTLNSPWKCPIRCFTEHFIEEIGSFIGKQSRGLSLNVFETLSSSRNVLLIIIDNNSIKLLC